MPIYEYECTKCGQVSEAFQRFSDKPLSKCSHCSGKLQRLISHSSFHLKGSGWYVTDYAGKSDVLVASWYSHFIHLPIRTVVGQKKTIDLDDMLWTGVLAATGQPRW